MSHPPSLTVVGTETETKGAGPIKRNDSLTKWLKLAKHIF